MVTNMDYSYDTDTREYSKFSKDAKMNVCFDYHNEKRFRKNLMKQIQKDELKYLKDYSSDTVKRYRERFFFFFF